MPTKQQQEDPLGLDDLMRQIRAAGGDVRLTAEDLPDLRLVVHDRNAASVRTIECARADLAGHLAAIREEHLPAK